MATCIQRRALIHLVSGGNHDPNQASAEVAKAKINLKQLAGHTSEKPAHLVAKSLADMGDDARVLFAKEDTSKKMVRKVRVGLRPYRAGYFR